MLFTWATIGRLSIETCGFSGTWEGIRGMADNTKEMYTPRISSMGAGARTYTGPFTPRSSSFLLILFSLQLTLLEHSPPSPPHPYIFSSPSSFVVDCQLSTTSFLRNYNHWPISASKNNFLLWVTSPIERGEIPSRCPLLLQVITQTMGM